MTIANEVAKHLLQIKAIKLSPQNPFTWASGIQSPIYCDNRITLSYPEVRNTIKAAFAQESSAFGDFDIVIGVATAGIPHGALLADAIGKPFAYVRSKAKGHGRQNLIEGEVKAGQKALVIEDLISTGGSCIKAVDALRENDIEVVGVMAIFTYGFEKAVRAFEKADCKFATLSNYDALIEEALASNYISENDLKVLTDFRANVGQ